MGSDRWATARQGAAGHGRGPTLIGSVRRAMRLLEAVAEQPGRATVKRLARAAGLPLATAYHLLRTLVHDGHLTPDGGLYVMGESARRLSGPADERAARAELADFGAAVYYAPCEDGEVNVVLTVEGATAPAVEE